MTNKNEVAAHIKRTGRTKLADTDAEMAIEDICELHGATCETPEPITFQAPDRDGILQWWTVRPDREVVLPGGKPFFMHADGPHHWTKRFRAKDDWQDRQLLEKGLAVRILRVDSPLLTTKRYWPNVWEAMVSVGYGETVRRRLER